VSQVKGVEREREKERKRGRETQVLHLFYSSSDQLIPTHTGEHGSSLLGLWIQMLISSGNTLRDTTTNIFVRSLAFLGWVEGPKASTKTRTPDL
jgi:hypothetical protein